MNKAEVINIEENLPHKVSEVICINCRHRWIAVRPEKTLLKDLKCPRCKTEGFVIETGEIIDYEQVRRIHQKAYKSIERIKW